MENDNPCKGCENNCCKSFKLFKSGEEVEGGENRRGVVWKPGKSVSSDGV